MQASKVTLSDIERAIAMENMTISGGNVAVGEMKRSVRVVGQYVDPNKIGDIVVQSLSGANIKLREIAEVKEGFEEQESFARLHNAPVITLNVIKRSGENLIAGLGAARRPEDNRNRRPVYDDAPHAE